MSDAVSFSERASRKDWIVLTENTDVISCIVFSKQGVRTAHATPMFRTANPWSSPSCRRLLTLIGLCGLASLAGCTSLHDYVRNGFKVGPNYGRPPAPVAENWIDAGDRRVRTDLEEPPEWWLVFRDPVLDALVRDTYQQNLTLRQAGFRVLQARAQYGIAVGSIFPQSQGASGAYDRVNLSKNVANPAPRPFFDQFQLGFGLAWEIDFWGR